MTLKVYFIDNENSSQEFFLRLLTEFFNLNFKFQDDCSARDKKELIKNFLKTF